MKRITVRDVKPNRLPRDKRPGGGTLHVPHLPDEEVEVFSRCHIGATPARRSVVWRWLYRRQEIHTKTRAKAVRKALRRGEPIADTDFNRRVIAGMSDAHLYLGLRVSDRPTQLG